MPPPPPPPREEEEEERSPQLPLDDQHLILLISSFLFIDVLIFETNECFNGKYALLYIQNILSNSNNNIILFITATTLIYIF